ncbi:hypothetical protein [Hymenobacter chitinivorans]|uniref:Multicomponent K+:H+ antiporter subunit F n=1 Tax=Hymenobacter chitinivorans DSM 11115 TaxID=1121954 RepID=A0A2M9BSB4_9BACT|nr:hypothetical protein [Hymenobacter chitinivorans]PJJ60835.1 multicomponent K+:H+ antiporter subunit F [Hymenobacter chitinivorans DSM 11115]
MSENPVASDHILRNNLLGVLAGAVVLGALTKVTDGGAALLFALGYGLQVVVNMILGAVRLVKDEPGRSAAPYFLSALLVLIIGFGACSLMLVTSFGNMH